MSVEEWLFWSVYDKIIQRVGRFFLVYQKHEYADEKVWQDTWHELFGGDGVSEELGRRESMACKSSAFGAPKNKYAYYAYVIISETMQLLDSW